MTTTTGLPPELEAYLASVRATLADLAPEERDDLLGELQAALLEAAGEGDGPVAARLGPPEEFAAELRASAGLDPATHRPLLSCAHYCGFRSTVPCMDTTQLLKGVLDLTVLSVVDDEDGYGYDVLRRLRAGGLTEVGDASVYGTLRRLYAAGALTSYVVPSEEGPHRRYYGITDRGRDQLVEARSTWRDFAGALSRLLQTDAEVTA